MANEPTLTIEAAPRDVTALAAVAPFQLRLLATKLGAFNTPEKNAAWHQLTRAQHPEYVLQLLKDYDSTHANGTNGTNGTMHAPTGIPALPPSAVAAVSPSATAAASAAAAPDTKKKSTRQPMTSPGAAATTNVTGPGIDLGEAVLGKFDELTKAVHGLNQTMTALGQHVAAADGKNSAAFQALGAEIAKIGQLQTWALTTLLTMGQGQLGAEPIDLLRSAVQDAGVLDTLVAQVQQELGKA